jgi:hypothetical protein
MEYHLLYQYIDINGDIHVPEMIGCYPSNAKANGAMQVEYDRKMEELENQDETANGDDSDASNFRIEGLDDEHIWWIVKGC